MKQGNGKKSIYKVQALERALDIIDCFSFQDRELSLTDVVNRTGLNKTTAKRLMSNLTTRGYLQQDPQSKKPVKPFRPIWDIARSKRSGFRGSGFPVQGCFCVRDAHRLRINVNSPTRYWENP
jgi:predicted transcriptional regulator